MKFEKITLNKMLKTFDITKDQLQGIYENGDKLELIDQIFTTPYHPDYDVDNDYFVGFINPHDYEDCYVFDRQNEDFFGIIAPMIKEKFKLYTYNQLSNTKGFNDFNNIELFHLYDYLKYFINPLKNVNYKFKDIKPTIKLEYDGKTDRVYLDENLYEEIDLKSKSNLMK